MAPYTAGLGGVIGQTNHSRSAFPMTLRERAGEPGLWVVDLEQAAGWQLIWAFPFISVGGLVLYVIGPALFPRRLYERPLRQHWPFGWARAFWLRMALVAFGWGALVACALPGALAEHRFEIVGLVLGESRPPWYGCVEGRALVGLGAGLALGLALTVVTFLVETRSARRREGSLPVPRTSPRC